VAGARVAPVTISVGAGRKRDASIDDDGDLAAQTAAVVRELRARNAALAGVKDGLRAWPGATIAVDGGRVKVGARRDAVYGATLAVDRAAWAALDANAQSLVLDAGVVALTHAAPSVERLTVTDVGAPRGRAAPLGRGRANKKLSAVVRAKRGCSYYA
jgi:hypothetical protein